jgi:hypothetical protein
MTKETTYKPNETYNILKSLVEANDAIMCKLSRYSRLG